MMDEYEEQLNPLLLPEVWTNVRQTMLGELLNEGKIEPCMQITARQRRPGERENQS